MARVLVGMGISKVRLTGGEPLLRKGVVEFVRELAKLRPQGLKPESSKTSYGTAEGVPFPKPYMGQKAFETPAPKQGGGNSFSEPLDIALTTNGHMLAELAQPLKDAGLTRVTVSMGDVDSDRFARITRVPNGYDHVLAGIRSARRAGRCAMTANGARMLGSNDIQSV